ncbi:MAG TPA: NADH-quinone oxidoreductase subunit J [Candidatus Nanopelagicales bacterium]
MSTLADATSGNVGETIVFWACAIVAVAGALGMLFSRKAVHSALFIATTMISLAVLYVSLQAPFLGLTQVVVYTGAVMMLFVFVIMIVGVESSDSLTETLRGQRIAGTIFGLGLLALLVAAIGSALTDNPVGLDTANAAQGGNVQGVAQLIFGRYLFAFELTSALLIVAALGAMILAFRERHRPKPTQRQLSRQRFAEGGHVTPLPGPGVYARHNAIGTPGLLPDGTTSDLSVPEPLRGRGVVIGADSTDLRQVQLLTDGAPVVEGEVAADPTPAQPRPAQTGDHDAGEQS